MRLEIETYLTTPGGAVKRIKIFNDKPIKVVNLECPEQAWSFLFLSKLRYYPTYISLMHDPKSFYSDQELEIIRSRYSNRLFIHVKNFLGVGSLNAQNTESIANELKDRLTDILSKTDFLEDS